MLRIILRDFIYGFLASLNGFIVLHKLDRVNTTRLPNADDESRNSNHNRPVKPLSILEIRRRERAKQLEVSGNVANRAITTNSGDGAADQLRLRPKAWKRVLQCIAMNLICILALEFLLLPCVRLLATVIGDRWLPKSSSQLFGAMSVLPLFLITRIVNALWFADIASASFNSQLIAKPRPIDASTSTVSLSRSIADFVIAIVLETLFLLQSIIVLYLPIPYMSTVLHFMHISLLYSLYSFEYMWMSKGYELSKRIRRIETYWPYYLGYGASLTLLTSISANFIVNGCIFGMVFPFFIISSFQSAGSNSPPFGSSSITGTSSDLVPIIRIFSPSLAVTNQLTIYLASVTIPSLSSTTH